MPKPLPKVRCPTCDTIWQPKRSHGVYCSPACRAVSWRNNREAERVLSNEQGATGVSGQDGQSSV